MGEGKGWISVHRKIQYSWLWQEKPFSKGQAWIDLLLSANHKDKKTLLGSELINVKRGSFITSQKKLMERWGWGTEKTRRFLKLLATEEMIKLSTDKRKTMITVVNYEEYQNQNGLNEDISTSSADNQNDNGLQTDYKQNDNGLQTETNNNDNKDNNITTTEKEPWEIALKYFCQKSGKLDLNLKPRELEAAQKICNEVLSLNTVLRGIDQAFDRFKPDTENDKINSFCYCIGIIKDLWKRENIKNGGKSHDRDPKQENTEKGIDSSGIGFHF
ncbi:hypothetical protein [Clostridium kluyveri]|uniref:DNA replication protein DnaD n=1 Tax=Clostridium kluyveri TaxID=1534 RepID=A0A1L5FC26_CLOKL|nr:hypothetical protein [Clostridium kluyveri]APM40505.1 hypothetical protein BS101_18115 [Clostridium kluyveri]APM40568.1 hypothetical protein BS101_18495 [Clostridium kluyveri]